MNASANTFHSSADGSAALPRAEHISLESEADSSVPAKRPYRKTSSTYRLASALRGCVTEISILEDHFVAVHSVRPGAISLKYEFDLRFANPKPVRVRHVSWSWLATTVALVAHGAVALWKSGWSETVLWGSFGAYVGIAALAGAIGTMFLFLRRTTESLEFVSVHGGATLVSVLGGIGSARAGKQFFVDLIKNINAAKLARPQPKQRWLRDEMREHHRLHELGALSLGDYEASKARILAAHS